MIDVEQLKKAVGKLVEKYRLDLVVLFGSQVRGKTHRESDIDIGVFADRLLGPMEVARLYTDLTQEAQMGNIEVVDLKNAPPLLLRNVARQSILLYEREPHLFARMKLYFIKLFFETRPLYEARQLRVERFIREHAK